MIRKRVKELEPGDIILETGEIVIRRTGLPGNKNNLLNQVFYTLKPNFTKGEFIRHRNRFCPVRNKKVDIRKLLNQLK